VQRSEVISTEPTPSVRSLTAGRLASWRDAWSWPAALPYLLTGVVSLWFFRATFLDGRLPGDLGDARWSLSVLEHWFQVWHGDASIRDLGVYFPIDRTLGLSDPFLAQGQFHSIARALGFDPVPAWFLAHFTTFVIGALGVAALSRKILRSPVQQCVFVATTTLSYPMIAQMNHIQTYGFLWVTWIVWAIHGLIWPTTPRMTRIAAVVLLLLPPVLALSSWYGLILGVVVLAALAVVTTVLSGVRPAFAMTRRTVATFLGALRSPVGVAFGLLGLGLWGLAAWVFLPGFDLLPEVRWIEVVQFSPRWSDLLRADLHGGGIWRRIYSRYYADLPQSGETELGFTPILALSLVGATVLALRRLIAPGRLLPATAPRSTPDGDVTADVLRTGAADASDADAGATTTSADDDPALDDAERPEPTDAGRTGSAGVDEAGTGAARPADPGPPSGTWALAPESVRRTFVHVVCCALTIMSLLVLFLVDERGNALFEFVWTNVPVMESIRAPFRIQMLLYPLAIYAVLRTVEAVASTGRFARRPALAVGLVSLVLGGLLMVEMYRPPNSQWTRDQLLPAPLDALVDDIEEADCDVLVVDGPAESVMESTQIDGTLLSVLTEKPTVHGYGRAAPTEHPGWDARAPELVDWLRDEGVDGPVCVVSAGRLEIER
jgi:hypothetical protein